MIKGVMTPDVAGGWFLERLMIRADGEWTKVREPREGTLWECGVKGVADGPDGWGTRVWLWDCPREVWFVGGWATSRGAWLPVPSGVRLPRRMVGRLMWRATRGSIVVPMRRAARLMEHWRGLGVSETDGVIMATLAAKALRAGGGSKRQVDKLVEKWVADEPLWIRAANVLDALRIVLEDGASIHARAWEFRLAGLAQLERDWARRWPMLRVNKKEVE